MKSQDTKLVLVKAPKDKKKKGEKQKKERLFIQFTPLIRKIVRLTIRKLPQNVEYDDVYSWAILGFLDAIEKFDPSRNCRFENYAAIRIQGAIIDGLRKEDHLSRNMRDRINAVEKANKHYLQKHDRKPTLDEIAKFCKLSRKKTKEVLNSMNVSHVCSFENVGGTDMKNNSPRTPLDELEEARHKQQIRKLIHTLDKVHRVVVEMYYFNEKSSGEIARKLKIDESKVYYLHKKALKQMRGRYKNMDSEDRLAA